MKDKRQHVYVPTPAQFKKKKSYYGTISDLTLRNGKDSC